MNSTCVVQGPKSIVPGFPNSGKNVPEVIAHALNENGLNPAETGLHIEWFPADLLPDVTTVTARIHRNFIDTNIDPDADCPDPGQYATGLEPAFSDGTNLGVTCADCIETATVAVCENAASYSTIVNRQFNTGWTMRQSVSSDFGFHVIPTGAGANRGPQPGGAGWRYETGNAARLRPLLQNNQTRFADRATSPGGIV